MQVKLECDTVADLPESVQGLDFALCSLIGLQALLEQSSSASVGIDASVQCSVSTRVFCFQRGL